MSLTMRALLLPVLLVAGSRVRDDALHTMIHGLQNMKADAEKHIAETTAAEKEVQDGCKETLQQLGFDIEDAQKAIDKAQGAVVQNDDIAARASKRSGEYAQARDANKGDMDAATKDRQAQAAEFQATKKDYEESIYALEQATSILKNKHADRAQAMMLLQKVALTHPESALSNYFSGKVEKPMAALPQTEGAPVADAYSSTLGPVLDMVEDMHSKIQKDLDELIRAESERSHAYDMFMKDASYEHDQNEAARNRKDMRAGQAQQASGKAAVEREDATAALNTATENRQKTDAECKASARTFAEDDQTRKEELAQLNSGLETMQKKVAVFMQVPRSFLQTRILTSDAKRQQVLSLLTEQAKNLKSAALSLIASKASTGSPFDKVMGMVQDMIARLQKQAEEEAAAKGICDKELRDNAALRKQKDAEVLQNTADRDSNQADKNQADKHMADTQAQIAALDKDMNDRTAARNDEAAANKKVIDETEAQIAGVDEGLKQLEEFYGSFTQLKARAVKQGQNTAFGTIKRLVEVIREDMQKVVDQTKEAESQASTAHDSFIESSKAQNEQSRQQVHKHKMTSSKEGHELRVSKKALAKSQTEHGEAMKQFDILNQQCNDPGISYEERVAKREQEIASLQEALDILSQ